MQVPLETSFKNVEATEDIKSLIRERVDKLHRHNERIISCRMAVEKPHGHVSTGNDHRVRIEVSIPPGKKLVVAKEPGELDIHDELPTVIRRAFDAMERQLESETEKLQGDVKQHDEPLAFVDRLFLEQGYGFLRTTDGRELYFHENAVVNEDFKELEIGSQVRFTAGMGEEGPKATTVHVVEREPGQL